LDLSPKRKGGSGICGCRSSDYGRRIENRRRKVAGSIPVGVAVSPCGERFPARRERPAVNSAPASTPSTTPVRNPNAMSVDTINPLMMRAAAQTRLVGTRRYDGVTKERRAASARLARWPIHRLAPVVNAGEASAAIEAMSQGRCREFPPFAEAPARSVASSSPSPLAAFELSNALRLTHVFICPWGPMTNLFERRLTDPPDGCGRDRSCNLKKSQHPIRSGSGASRTLAGYNTTRRL
jgi:hypothetical protein